MNTQVVLVLLVIAAHLTLRYLTGTFDLTNKRPKCNQAGNWIAPDGSGRTFYIGKRKNGNSPGTLR